WRDSLTVGALANSRGMTELVVLQIGAQLGVIDNRMLVLLTAATLIMTVAVAPAVVLLSPPGRRRQATEAPPDRLAEPAAAASLEVPESAG
ncbi:MAG: cation:proton antiporter, partial [Jatrophihabitantaceae bacterium]